MAYGPSSTDHGSLRLSHPSTGGEIVARGVHENARAPSAPSPARHGHVRSSGNHAGCVGLAGGCGSARLGNRAGRRQLQRCRILRVSGCSVPRDQRWHLQCWRVHPRGCHLGSWRGSERAGGCSLSSLWRACGWGLDRPARRGAGSASHPMLTQCSRDLLRRTGTRGYGAGWRIRIRPAERLDSAWDTTSRHTACAI
jgi:hypothetical protein